MSRKKRCFTWGLLVPVVLSLFQVVHSQGKIVGRYYKDEQRSKLVLDQPFIAGNRVDGKIHALGEAGDRDGSG